MLRWKKFTIDEDDYELSKQYVWHIDKNNYVITKLKNGRVIKQHRLFLGVIDEKGIEVDHINHQTTDNRRCNLRLSDRSLNCLNRRRGKCNKSGTVGVYEQSQGYGWIAQLKTGNGNNKYLGCFKTKEEAIKARLTEEQKYNISTEW